MGKQNKLKSLKNQALQYLQGASVWPKECLYDGEAFNKLGAGYMSERKWKSNTDQYLAQGSL